MAVSWLQKLQLFLRGWGRRREAATRQRDEEFLRRNTAWAPSVPAAAALRQPRAVQVEKLDVEGLCVAYLDESGRIAHYLDITNGEVVDHLLTAGDNPFVEASRYRRVPCRTAASESEDRAVFIRGLTPSRTKSLLEQAVSRNDAAAFRQTLGDDRAAERAWYSFKNDRASSAIDAWLATLDKPAPGRQGN